MTSNHPNCFSTSKFCVFFICCVFFCSFSAFSKNYYFSTSTGNDTYTAAQAQSQSTPWKTISKLNSIFSTLVAGDIIYFKRGEVFYGGITATKSGSASAPITFTAYGTGNRPVISGFTAITSWTSAATNVYQSTVSAASASLNLVVINDIPRSLGRYPNFSTTTDPFLYYETFASNGTSITDNQLSSAIDWTGANLVIKKRRWVMDKCKITKHSGSTITYTNPNSYPGTAGFGYFIENDARTLDQFGEWYMNPTTKNLQVHFGGAAPTASTVKVSTVDILMNLGATKYIVIKELAFEGANVAGFSAQNGSNITLQQCDFNFMGEDGVLIKNSPNALVENLNVTNVLNNGVCINNELVSYATVRNCNIKNCGTLPGMGENGDGTYRGLTVNANSNVTVEFNNIENIGYNALEFQGNNVVIKNNFINNYCTVKDDGGGIYSWANGGSTTYTNRKIYGNIIMNAIGAAWGTAGQTAEAKGVYLDGGTMNVEIYDNAIANMARTGLLLNNATNVKLNGNTVFNSRFGVELVRLLEGSQVRNIEMKRNIIYPKTVNQSTIYYKNMYLNSPVAISIQADMQAIGVIDSNYYATPNTIGFGYFYSLNYSTIGTIITPAPLSLEGWQTLIAKDKASKRPAKTAAATDSIRFEYNATNAAKTITLDASYIGVDSTIYNGAITLDPYTAKILVKNGAVTTPAPPATQSLTAAAAAPAISCFDGTTSVTVTGTGGTAPYTGTGTFTASAGKGTLKIDVANPVAGTNTLLYSSVGVISSAKNYVLRFSTLGTNSTGSLTAALRLTKSPFTYVTAKQTKTFGTGVVEHEFIFTKPTSDKDVSFIVELAQAAGTTYFDNIAFFEATATGTITSDNLFKTGQFESSISDIITWSATTNHTATLDITSKIANIPYYAVKDAKGLITVAAAKLSQPASALVSTSTAGVITIVDGVTSVAVSATGGTAPYTGTGTFTSIKAGTYTYTVKDAAGCSSSTTVTIAAAVASALKTTVVAPAISCYGGNTNINITATGGTAPYTGTGNYSANAGTGSLRITVAKPVNKENTLLYWTIGEVSSAKNYVLRFSTLGTTTSGSLKAGLRMTNSPFTNITATQTKTFGTTRVDHEFLFKAPPDQDAASFIIELAQSSGTTYFDNIACFEATETGELVSGNLYSAGQFENSISEIYTWTKTNNHVATLDQTSKITNTYYYPVEDAKGIIGVAAAKTVQPAAALTATATSGIISIIGGLTSVVVNATGGTAPYTGTGTFSNVKIGTYTYTVRDAAGCTVSTTLTIKLTTILGRSSDASAGESISTDSIATSTLATEVNGKLSINSYPNPSTTEFNLAIKGGTKDPVNIVVQSMDGRIVYQAKGTTNANYTFGNSFTTGMYVVKVIQGKQTQVLKLIKSGR